MLSHNAPAKQRVVKGARLHSGLAWREPSAAHAYLREVWRSGSTGGYDGRPHSDVRLRPCAAKPRTAASRQVAGQPVSEAACR